MTDNRDAHTEQMAEVLEEHQSNALGECRCDGQWRPWDYQARHQVKALLPVVARIKTDTTEQATNDAYTLGYMKGQQRAAEVAAAAEPILTYLEGIEDFFAGSDINDVIDTVDGSSESPALTFGDLRNLRAALSAGRTTHTSTEASREEA